MSYEFSMIWRKVCYGALSHTRNALAPMFFMEGLVEECHDHRSKQADVEERLRKAEEKAKDLMEREKNLLERENGQIIAIATAKEEAFAIVLEPTKKLEDEKAKYEATLANRDEELSSLVKERQHHEKTIKSLSLDIEVLEGRDPKLKFDKNQVLQLKSEREYIF